MIQSPLVAELLPSSTRFNAIADTFSADQLLTSCKPDVTSGGKLYLMKGASMRYLALLIGLACSSARPRVEPPPPAVTILPGTYALRANAPAAAAGMPTLTFEFTPDGVLRVSEGSVLHVRTLVAQRSGGELEFLDQEGPRACRNPDPIPGHYRAERTAEGWLLHVISDACDGRKGLWTGAHSSARGNDRALMNVSSYFA